MANLEEELVILFNEKKELKHRLDLIDDRIIAIKEEKRNRKEKEYCFSVINADHDDLQKSPEI